MEDDFDDTAVPPLPVDVYQAIAERIDDASSLVAFSQASHATHAAVRRSQPAQERLQVARAEWQLARAMRDLWGRTNYANAVKSFFAKVLFVLFCLGMIGLILSPLILGFVELFVVDRNPASFDGCQNAELLQKLMFACGVQLVFVQAFVFVWMIGNACKVSENVTAQRVGRILSYLRWLLCLSCFGTIICAVWTLFIGKGCVERSVMVLPSFFFGVSGGALRACF